jgi:hypothetical protein
LWATEVDHDYFDHGRGCYRTRVSGRCDSGKQIRTRLGEADERAALVQHQPAALDRQVEAGLLFGRRAFLAKQERPVDQLDVDPGAIYTSDRRSTRQVHSDMADRDSSHSARRVLICLKFRIAGLPSRTIVARLRSLEDNIIALTTAERSFIVP